MMVEILFGSIAGIRALTMIFLVNWFMRHNTGKAGFSVGILTTIVGLDCLALFAAVVALILLQIIGISVLIIAISAIVGRTIGVIYLSKWFCVARPDKAGFIKRLTGLIVILDLSFIMSFFIIVL